jgi:hypothetical protein
LTKNSILAVQTVVGQNEIPMAVAMALFCQEFGAGLSIAIAQSIIVNHLLPLIRDVDPELTRQRIVEAGATGLKDLVTSDLLPRVLVAYAESIDFGAFILATVMSGISTLAALGVEWRSVKQRSGALKKRVEDPERVG